jgi:hypothetical protein
MPGGNSQISKAEQIAFFTLVLFGLALRLLELALSFAFAKPQSESFGIYDIFDMWEIMSPIYSFIVFCICTGCSWKISIPSLVCSIIPMFLLVLFFDRWFIDSRRMVVLAAEMNPNFQFKTFDFAVTNGSFYDFLTLCLVNILLVWQMSLFVRSIRRNSVLT